MAGFFGGSKQLGEFLKCPYHRAEHPHQQLHAVGGEGKERSPIHRADELGDDLREDQDQHGQDERDQTKPLASENGGHFNPHARRANGVDEGIERENGRDRGINVVLQAFHHPPRERATLIQRFYIRPRAGKHHRLPQRTERRNAQRS